MADEKWYLTGYGEKYHYVPQGSIFSLCGFHIQQYPTGEYRYNIPYEDLCKKCLSKVAVSPNRVRDISSEEQEH